MAEPSPITLTTSGSSGGTANPRSGAPFTAGLAGSGAIAGEWQNMSATPVEPTVTKNVNFCEDVENQIGGPGGIWMERKDLVPPPAPLLLSTDPASPSLSGTPRILGSAEPGSTVRIYANSTCQLADGRYTAAIGGELPAGGAGSAAELASPGIAVKVPGGTTETFSATATDAAGNVSACSAPISYTRIHGDPPPPPSAGCVVPKLTGKTLDQARAALKKASCGLGKVHRPRHRKGKKTGPLVVRSSTPSAGANLTTGSAVNLKLGRKPHKARHAEKRERRAKRPHVRGSGSQTA